MRMHIRVGAVLCVLSRVALAQSIEAVPSTAGDIEKALEQRINVQAKQYSEWRQSLLSNPGQIDAFERQSNNERFDSGYGSAPSTARTALARFGDTEQFEEIACQAFAKKPHAQIVAIRQLQDVGGYMSIKVLSDLMLTDPPMRQLGGDQMDMPMRQLAVTALIRLVPEMPVSSLNKFMWATTPSYMTEEDAREWYNWIMEHREQLGRLQPNETIELDARSCAERQSQKKKHAKRLSSQPAQH